MGKDLSDANKATLEDLLAENGWTRETVLFRATLPEHLSDTDLPGVFETTANPSASEAVVDIYGSGHGCVAEHVGPGLAFAERGDNSWAESARTLVQVRVSDVIDQGGLIYPVESVITEKVWYATLPSGRITVRAVEQQGVETAATTAQEGLSQAEQQALRLAAEGATVTSDHSPLVSLLQGAAESIATAREGKLRSRPTQEVIREIKSNLEAKFTKPPLAAAVYAEGLGKSCELKGRTVVIDPMDGELAYSNRTASFATSIALFADDHLQIAVLANPSTGEILYATEDESRLLQLGLVGAPSVSTSLPLHRGDQSSILLNLRATQEAAALLETAMSAWQDSSIHLVTMTGGSPALAIAECAKGRFAYANLWSTTEVFPFDLAAGVAILRRAGGDVIGLDGTSIDPLSHKEPFVAALDEETRKTVLGLIKAPLRAFNESRRMKQW